MSLGKILSLQDHNMLYDPAQYRSVVDALQYSTITRPEMAHLVNKLC